MPSTFQRGAPHQITSVWQKIWGSRWDTSSDTSTLAWNFILGESLKQFLWSVAFVWVTVVDVAPIGKLREPKVKFTVWIDSGFFFFWVLLGLGSADGSSIWVIQDIKNEDWSKYVTPFWPAVMKSALSIQGLVGLAKSGNSSYETVGLIKHHIITFDTFMQVGESGGCHWTTFSFPPQQSLNAMKVWYVRGYQCLIRTLITKPSV